MVCRDVLRFVFIGLALVGLAGCLPSSEALRGEPEAGYRATYFAPPVAHRDMPLEAKEIYNAGKFETVDTASVATSTVGKSVFKTPQPVGGTHPGRSGPLSEKEMAMAKRAWIYFENNTDPKTGLANAVNNYPSTTLWDTASYIAGAVSARELGIISPHEFDKRMTRLLGTFNKMDFFRSELPNKVYNTATAAKVDYGNQPGEIGYSAIDLGRIMIWLYIVKQRYPTHADAIDRFLLRWNYCNVIDERGTMFGAVVDPADNSTLYVQEGRLGYEEYAAKGFMLWGFYAGRALLPDPYETVRVFDVAVPYDRRDPRELAAHNYVVAESYVLSGIEFNWDVPFDRSNDNFTHSLGWNAEFAQRIYAVQERRYQRTGVLTARTEHQLDEAPYFVYDTIYSSGHIWNTITDTGEYVPQYAAIAAKGAMGLWALWDTPYTDLLFDTIEPLYHPEKGFYEGRYENGSGIIEEWTANNNGIILETLLYKATGPLIRYNDIPSQWEYHRSQLYLPDGQCIRGREGSTLEAGM